MKEEVDSGATQRAFFAGALGGIVAVALLAIVGALVLRRSGPTMMRGMMRRMMRDGECSPEMRACMEKCGCGPAPEPDAAVRHAKVPSRSPD